MIDVARTLNEHPSLGHPESSDFILEPPDNRRLANLCGQLDEHLRQIEKSLGVEINHRGNSFRILGDNPSPQAASEVIQRLYEDTREVRLTPGRVHLLLREAGQQEDLALEERENAVLRTRRSVVKGRNPRQARYLRNILDYDINFGIGPAGTGKTYLAVACAVEALETEQVRRLILVRPAVEAGERLGFLPGDLAQKVDPYLRPLYDALYEMLGLERVNKLMERHVIEVAPLAYMRGRTLNESFIILDEAQNTTIEQMKMFLTRLGYGSSAVVTGDITQIDLPKGQLSGLRHVIGVLREVEGISFTFFKARDVVRHPLVQRVVQAYERFERDSRGG